VGEPSGWVAQRVPPLPGWWRCLLALGRRLSRPIFFFPGKVVVVSVFGFSHVGALRVLSGRAAPPRFVSLGQRAFFFIPPRFFSLFSASSEHSPSAPMRASPFALFFSPFDSGCRHSVFWNFPSKVRRHVSFSPEPSSAFVFSFVLLAEDRVLSTLFRPLRRVSLPEADLPAWVVRPLKERDVIIFSVGVVATRL